MITLLSTVLVSLARVLLVLLAGRLLLSFLPPGRPGGHSLHDLPATIAASTLLGMVATHAVSASLDLGNFDPGLLWPVILVVAALFARLVTLPGAMVPRHEPRFEKGNVVSRWLWIAAIVMLALRFVRGEDFIDGERFAAGLVACLLIDHGLEAARCTPVMRSGASALFAYAFLVCGGYQQEIWGTVSFVGGAAFTIGWLRRADRRARALAALGYAGAAVFLAGGWALACSGLAWLVFATPRPSRRSTAFVAGTAILLASPAVWWHERFAFLGTMGSPPSESVLVWWRPDTVALTGAMVTYFLVNRSREMRSFEKDSWNSSGAPIGQEERVLVLTLATGLAALILVNQLWPLYNAGRPLLEALSVLAILCGLSLRRFDRAAAVA